MPIHIETGRLELGEGLRRVKRNEGGIKELHGTEKGH